MKALSILLVSFFACLTIIASPVNNNLIKPVYDKTLPDLSKDESFIKSVNEIILLQTQLNKTNSNESLKTSFINIGISIMALKNKYEALNDNASATIMINAGIDKLVNQGRIEKSNNLVCLRQLYAAIVVCLRTSTSYAGLAECVRAAYDQFVACLHAPH